MTRLTEADLISMHDKAHDLLDEVVTPEGIFASAAIGWDGPYHAFFLRDSAETTDFLTASVAYGGDRKLARRALEATGCMMRYQGKKDVAETGEVRGAGPHEIRFELDNETSNVQHAAGTNEQPWYIDPYDTVLKNWDTADGTPLWILTILRGHQRLGETLDVENIASLREALCWIIRNKEKYGGLVGFTGAGEQPGRTFSGLHNQGWKDTESIYQMPDGHAAKHPIKDVLVNAEAWAALHDGSLYFAESDPEFSVLLADEATQLKRQFNDKDAGFISMTNESVLAQAIDGTGQKLEQSAVDQGAVLWARTSDDQLCIDEATVRRVVEKMLSAGMFNPEAGIRDYAIGTRFNGGTGYHGSSHTYWPFMSGKVARGLEQAGYVEESRRVMKGFLSAIDTLGTNIEMFIQSENDEFEPWSHPDPNIGQKSSRQQAWTAAAVYYATQYLLAHNEYSEGAN